MLLIIWGVISAVSHSATSDLTTLGRVYEVVVWFLSREYLRVFWNICSR